LKKKSQLVAVESLDLDQETSIIINGNVTHNEVSVPQNMLRSTGIVFVTFKYLEAASRCLHDHRLNPPPSHVSTPFSTFSYYFQQKNLVTSEWEVTSAPDPQDIIWANLQNPGGLGQKITQNVIMILSSLIIMILVVATAAISQFRSMFSLLNVKIKRKFTFWC
jgi:hypothetical protein